MKALGVITKKIIHGKLIIMTTLNTLTIKDLLHRFVFEHTAVRGNLVHLDDTFASAIQHQHCPAFLRKLLGELMAAAALLASTLKMEGALVLQIQGRGNIKLMVVECTQTDHLHEISMRATAKWSEELKEDTLQNMVGDGQFVITLDPKDGTQGYQGVVALEGESIAQILEHYMLRSEQIETRIWLSCDLHTAAGLLVQKLPDATEAQADEHQLDHDPDAWPRVCMLAETVKEQELLSLSAINLIKRLFGQEDVRLFEPQHIEFHCTCSQHSVGSMLRMLGQSEVYAILEERDSVEVNCDFCNASYVYDKVDIDHLFSASTMMPSSDVRH